MTARLPSLNALRAFEAAARLASGRSLEQTVLDFMNPPNLFCSCQNFMRTPKR